MVDQIEKAIDLVLEQDQNEFLELLKSTHRIDKYTIRPDGLVDVEGRILLSFMHLTKIPIKFGIVNGSFNCADNYLTSLHGAPEEVGDDFWCAGNQLTSLEGCPGKVGVDFDCSYNQLTSLIGSPKEVEGDFDCSGNQLTSLIGCPKKVGYVYCDNNPVEFTQEDIKLAKQGKAPLGLPLSFVLMKNKEKEYGKEKLKSWLKKK